MEGVKYNTELVEQLDQKVFGNKGCGLLRRVQALEPDRLKLKLDGKGLGLLYSRSDCYWLYDCCKQGQSTTVYRARRYSLLQNQGEPTERIVKISMPPRNQHGLSIYAFREEPTLDVSVSGRSCPQLSMAIYRASDCDLTEFAFQKESKPIAFILGQLANWMSGLDTLHEGGLQHGKIEGSHLLINHDRPGCVTGFGNIAKLTEEGRRADLRALGLTVQEEILYRLITELADAYKVGSLALRGCVWDEEKSNYQRTLDDVEKLRKAGVLNFVQGRQLRRLANLALELQQPTAEFWGKERVSAANALSYLDRTRRESCDLKLKDRSDWYRLKEMIGKGTTSEVWRATRILGGGRTEEWAIKCSNSSFTLENWRLQQVKLGERKTVDLFREVFSQGNLHFAVCELSDGDLESFDFSTSSDPVGFALRHLTDWADGVARIHKSGQVHRDLKSENLLVNREGPGRVTDVGLMQEFSKTKRFTQSPPHITAPYTFDSLWDQYRAHRVRATEEQTGWHTKGSDVFAFGRTLFSDLVVKILDDLDVDRKELEQFKPIPVEIRFKKLPRLGAKIRQLEKDFKDQVVMDLGQEGSRLSYFLLPDRNEALAAVEKIIDGTSRLTVEEKVQLRELARLATGLMSPSRRELCEFLRVSEKQENEGDLLMREVEARLKMIQESGEPALKRWKSGE